MIKVMIIDDDSPIRSYLRNIIQWEALGLQLVCEAGDSENARELYYLHRPRIVITDINIPVISGLELAKEFIKEDRNVRIIVITGFSDFKYAKDAISLGAIDLISKPILQEEINTSLKKAIAHFKALRQQLKTANALNNLLSDHQNVLREHCIAQLFSHAHETEETKIREQLRLLSFPEPEKYMAAVRLIPIPPSEQYRSSEFSTVFQKFFETALKECGFYVFGFWNISNQLELLAAWSFSHGDDRLEEILFKLYEEIQFYFQAGFSAGIGGVVTAFSELYKSAEQAALALQFKDMSYPNITNYRNVDRIYEPNPLDHSSILEQLTSCIKNYFYNDFCTTLKVWLPSKNGADTLNKAREMSFTLLTHLSNICYNSDFSPWSAINYPDTISKLYRATAVSEIEELLSEIGSKLINILLQQRSKSKSQLIRLAKKYVQEHLGEQQLSLETVSNHIGLSKNYFCHLFHKEEKISFNVYVNGERISHAKHLLINTNKKVFEISDMVGYSNPKYFNYVFKHSVGITPLEYRKKDASSGKSMPIL